MRALEERTRAASAAAKDRFHKRGQLLPRERVALVLDPGSPFLELSTLAGYMFDVPDADKSVPGGGVIAGIGFVSGVRCMVSANDSGIDAGALQPYGLDKTLRVQELALENKLPYVQLVESAGANLLRYRVEDFVRGGNIFRNLARLSAAGLAGRHRDARLVDRGRRLPDRTVRLHRDGARPHPRLSRRAAAAEGRDRRDRDRGGTRRRRDAHLAFPASATISPRTTATRCGSRATSWPIWNGTGRAGAKRSLQAAALRCRRTARHHADGPQAPGRHAPGDRALRRRFRFHRVRRQLRPRHRVRPRPHRGPGDRHHHQQRPARSCRRQQGDAFHPGLLPVAHAAALSQQHHRLHGRQGL